MIEWWMILIFVVGGIVLFLKGVFSFEHGMVAVPIAGICMLFAFILFLIKVFS